jgi:heterodisulfide reductase subunit B
MTQETSSTREIAFFPGCTLATSAKENYQSLASFCERMGYILRELPDWNCCGTSSAHSIHEDAAFHLPARNLALAPREGTLLVACPSCSLRLKQTQHRLLSDSRERSRFESSWGTPPPDKLEILPFLAFLARLDLSPFFAEAGGSALHALRFAPYYGCMLARPASLPAQPSPSGVMESVLERLGAKSCRWSHATRCCGTFLAAARPDIVTPRINAMMEAAAHSGAECIVTACSMCHFSLELRATRRQQMPVFHFAELLAMATGIPGPQNWFKRHLVDPVPLLRRKELIA